MIRLLAPLLAALACGVRADAPARVGGARTLVLLEDLGLRQSHSAFFADLAGARQSRPAAARGPARPAPSGQCGPVPQLLGSGQRDGAAPWRQHRH